MEKKFRYLVPGDYMADPAVHVFDGKLYIYPSHDRESGVEENDNGDHFDMCDYHVFSTEDVMNGTVTDHGVVLKVSDVPWAGRQLWDCDVACKNGNYYMYFPLKDRNDIFRIYNPQIQISAESETKRSIFREKDKTKRSKKESAQHSKSRNKSFVMTSVSAL